MRKSESSVGTNIEWVVNMIISPETLKPQYIILYYDWPLYIYIYNITIL